MVCQEHMPDAEAASNAGLASASAQLRGHPNEDPDPAVVTVEDTNPIFFGNTNPGFFGRPFVPFTLPPPPRLFRPRMPVRLELRHESPDTPLRRLIRLGGLGADPTFTNDDDDELSPEQEDRLAWLQFDEPEPAPREDPSILGSVWQRVHDRLLNHYHHITLIAHLERVTRLLDMGLAPNSSDAPDDHEDAQPNRDRDIEIPEFWAFSPHFFNTTTGEDSSSKKKRKRKGLTKDDPGPPPWLRQSKAASHTAPLPALLCLAAGSWAVG